MKKEAFLCLVMNLILCIYTIKVQVGADDLICFSKGKLLFSLLELIICSFGLLFGLIIIRQIKNIIEEAQSQELMQSSIKDLKNIQHRI